MCSICFWCIVLRRAARVSCREGVIAQNLWMIIICVYSWGYPDSLILMEIKGSLKGVLICKQICMEWTKHQVVTDAVWIFIKIKVHSLFPNVGIRRKVMQSFYTAWHWTASCCLQSILIVRFLRRPAFAALLHYMHESVGGAKQAVM